MPQISFVILTWNSENTIQESLASIGAKCRDESISHEIFVVDNGSNDNTIELIEALKKEMPIDLTCLPDNQGTTKPRNMALRRTSGDIVCVMDSDAVLKEGALSEIFAMLEADESIGIIAPQLVFPDGSKQVSVRKFPSFFGKFGKIPHIILKLKYQDRDVYQDFPFSVPTDVDYAIAACWFFKRSLLETAGYLDEKIFYAPEDIDFGLRVHKIGKRVVYFPDFKVIHHVQRLTHQKAFGKIAVSHFLGLVYYFIKHRYLIKPLFQKDLNAK